MDPASYESWYHTPRGRWIAQREAALVKQLLKPASGCSLLDVGCGTGHFSRRFAAWPAQVTGLDPDARALDFARAQGGGVRYLQGDAQALPFAAGHFEYATAITSLCFVESPAQAVAEMWRVASRGIVLGLLNRHSLLHRRSAGLGGYAGARWDTPGEALAWTRDLQPRPRLRVASAVFFPGGGPVARVAEILIPSLLPLGAFLVVLLER